MLQAWTSRTTRSLPLSPRIYDSNLNNSYHAFLLSRVHSASTWRAALSVVFTAPTAA